MTQEVQQIVSNLQELHEISAQLVASLEESIEMSGEEGEGPQAGFIFEETAEVSKQLIHTETKSM